VRAYTFGVKRDDFTIQEMENMGVNLVGWGAGYHLRNLPQLKTEQEVKEEIKNFHKAGIKVIGRTTLIIVRWEELYEQFPEAKEHVVLKEDGKPQLWKRRPHSHIINVLDPYWIDLHARGLKYAIEMGDDAFHYDNPQAILSYDEQTKKMWKEYIVEKLGRDIPLEDAIKSKDRVTRSNLDVFRYNQLLKFLEEIKKEAEKVGDIKIKYTAHIDPSSIYYWTEGEDVTDIVSIENSNASPWWFEPEGESLLGFMISYACTNDKPTGIGNKLLFKVDEFWKRGRYWSFDWQDPSPDRYELYAAEATAMGGMFRPVIPPKHYVIKFNKQYNNHPETLKDYYSFQKKMEYYYTKTNSPANITLLISDKSYIYKPDTFKQSMFGVAELLLKNHVPFDIKVIENDEGFKLDQYTTLIANHLAVVEDKIMEKIKNRVISGANLLVLGELGTRKENFLSNPNPVLKKQVDEATLGKGKVIWLPFDAVDLFQKFNQPHTQKSATDLMRHLKQEKERWSISSQNNGEDLIIIIPRIKENNLIIHCLNYNFHLLDKGTEEKRISDENVIPQKNVKIEIDRRTLSGVEKVKLFVPGEKTEILDFEETNHKISFSIPRLAVYAMIVCQTY
jgi:hypothetical protein